MTPYFRNAFRPLRLLVLGIGCIAVFAGCGNESKPFGSMGYFDREYDSGSFTDEHFQLIRDRCELALPSGAVGKHFLWLGKNLDPAFYALIELPAASADAVVKQVSEIKKRDMMIDMGHLNPAWWQPKNGSIIAERYYPLSGAAGYVSVVENGGKYLLYIFWTHT